MQNNTIYFLLLSLTTLIGNAGEEAADTRQSQEQSSGYTVRDAMRFLVERVKGERIYLESHRYHELEGKILVVKDTDKGTTFSLLTSKEYDTLILQHLAKLCVGAKDIFLNEGLFSREVVQTRGAGSLILWPSSLDQKRIHTTAVVKVHDFGQKKYEEGRAYERSRIGQEAFYTMALGAAVGFGAGAIATMCWFLRKPIFNP